VDQYPPYSCKDGTEFLFRALQADLVIEVFIALILEKKVILISNYKSLLSHACFSLLSYLFPLCWKHSLIPILPRSQIDFVEAPFPYLIGIEQSILEEEEMVEFPEDTMQVYLDMNIIKGASDSSKY